MMKKIIKKILRESDFGWADGISDEFTPEMLRYGQKFSNKWGKYIRTIMFVGMDDEEICYEPPCTLLRFHIIDDPSGYKPYPMSPNNDKQNIELVFNPNDLVERLKDGTIQPLIDDEFKFLED